MTARVSIVIPTYCSELTVERCLASITQQTFRDFETIVVDSSPNATTGDLVAAAFPQVTLIRSDRRLLPHAARNAGVLQSSGELIVFTDPDIYFCSHWLETLVRSYDTHRQAIVGAIGCFGTRWLHRGFHMTKFSKWLPHGRALPVDNAPSGNLLVSRSSFVRAGGFPGDSWSGDVELSRRLRAAGETLLFEPDAVGEHHHTQTFLQFCRERIERGAAFGELRSSWYEERLVMRVALLIASILPVRLARILSLVVRQAAAAGQLRCCLSVMPIVAIGYVAALSGEARAYFRSIVQRQTQPVHDEI